MSSFEDIMRALNGGQKEALDRKLFLAAGGEKDGAAGLKAILDGDLKIVLQDAVRKLLDQHGRRIPHNLKAAVVDANRNFLLERPVIDFTARLARVTLALAGGKEFMAAEEFEQRIKAIERRLAGDKPMANICNGVGLPFALPQMLITLENHGAILDDKVLVAVGASYKEQFQNRKFTNHRHGTLAGEVTIEKASRHLKFLERLAKGAVVGMYYPALQGFSLAADLEQMDGLPEDVLLAGAIDTSAVAIMWPDVVARNFNTLGLDCAAVRWQGDSLFFKADDDGLVFLGRDLGAGGYCSGGLVVLG